MSNFRDDLTTEMGSPIERDLFHRLLKVIQYPSLIRREYEIQTICGRFRIDFVAELPVDRSPIPARIGIEADGKDFHDAERDEWRDALILGSGQLAAIYRLSGSLIYRAPYSSIAVIANDAPEYFSERGRHIVSMESRDESWDEATRAVDREYGDIDDENRNRLLSEFSNRNLGEDFPGAVRNLGFVTMRHARPLGREHWQTLFNHATRLAPECRNVESLIAARKSEKRTTEQRRRAHAV